MARATVDRNTGGCELGGGCSRIHTVVGEYWGEVVARITGMRHVLEEGKLGDCAVSRKLNQFQL
jgi:hypothetical protein